jgi:phage antirepressor YoqD-like protein
MTNLALNTQNSTPFNTTIIATNNTTITMTSLEIVDFINNHRKANGNNTELRHDDFMRKVPQVLGEMNAPKFYGTQTYGNNNMRTIGNFPKREACLMAMSYSYDIQAEIYDRMTAMEQHILMLNRPSYMIEDPVERAKKWIEECNQKQEAETKLLEANLVIEVMQPTVDAYELIAGKRGSMCFQDAYKFLGGLKLKEMKKWLFDKKWMYKDRFDRDAISYTYQSNGYLVVKATAHQPQIRITYRGLAAMARQMKIELNAEDFT